MHILAAMHIIGVQRRLTFLILPDDIWAAHLQCSSRGRVGQNRGRSLAASQLDRHIESSSETCGPPPSSPLRCRCCRGLRSRCRAMREGKYPWKWRQWQQRQESWLAAVVAAPSTLTGQRGQLPAQACRLPAHGIRHPAAAGAPLQPPVQQDQEPAWLLQTESRPGGQGSRLTPAGASGGSCADSPAWASYTGVQPSPPPSRTLERCCPWAGCWAGQALSWVRVQQFPLPAAEAPLLRRPAVAAGGAGGACLTNMQERASAE